MSVSDAATEGATGEGARRPAMARPPQSLRRPMEVEGRRNDRGRRRWQRCRYRRRRKRRAAGERRSGHDELTF